MPHTIYALSSASGRAAIAVIRVSGPAAHSAAEGLGATGLIPRYAVVRRLTDPVTSDPLDDALILRFDAPASATGEDMIEFHVHGGRAVVGGVLDALGRCSDCRPAEPGEFTRRAFENGKLDLTAVEGLVDLIDSETALQRKQAFFQYAGGLAGRYDAWRQQLLEAMALVEAGLDFSDEADVADRAYRDALELVSALKVSLQTHLASANRGEIVRSGFRVALAGIPNSGKSSLLNALAARDVAIVSHEAGTTRDVIEVQLDLGGVPVTLSDTAGLREADGAIEREGISRARATIANADLVVWLIDPQHPVKFDELESRYQPTSDVECESDRESGTKIENGAEKTKPVVAVLSKMDIARPGQLASIEYDIRLSAKNGDGIDDLTGLIVAAALRQLEGSPDPPPTMPRHRAHLNSALAHIESFIGGDCRHTELRAEDLRLAAMEFGRLTGRIDVEEILGTIFSRFCIGK